MAAGRFGDIDSGRFGDIEYTPLEDTPANLSAAYPLDFAAEQASVRFTSDKAGETAYIVVTDSDTQPTAEQIEAGEDHTGSAAEAADSLTSAVGENEFSALAIGAGYWYAHIVQGESDVVSTVQFRVAGDGDIFGVVTTPAGDSVFPEEAAAGDYYFVDVVSGEGVEVLSNGSSSASSDSWSLNTQIWDQSLNGGLGGLSGVHAVAFAPPVGGEASIEAVAELTVTGRKDAFGAVGMVAAAAIAAAGEKHATGASAVGAVAALESQGLKHAFGTVSMEAVAQVSAQGTSGQAASGAASMEAVASLEVAGRKHAFGVVSMSAVARATAAGGPELPGSVVRTVVIPNRSPANLGRLTAGDDYQLVHRVLDDNREPLSLIGLQSAIFRLQGRTGELVAVKTLDSGIAIDTSTSEMTITLDAADTEGLSGARWFEVELRDADGKYRTPVYGTMVLRAALIANAS